MVKKSDFVYNNTLFRCTRIKFLYIFMVVLPFFCTFAATFQSV